MNEDINYMEEGTVKEEVKVRPPFCVVSLDTFGEYGVHDIQTNSCWSKNPYEEGYASVPEWMTEKIVATKGFCDIVFSEDGTEVISFTARQIPDIDDIVPEKEEVTWEDMAQAINEGVKEV